MCGIFGLIASQAQPSITLSAVRRLGTRNTERGNLGFGALIMRNHDLSAYHFTRPFDADPLPADGAQIVLGHVRAPTGGQSDSIAEIHPFETRDLYLAHNGLLLNHAHFAEWRIDPALHVDSQVIIGGIQHALDAGLALTEAIRRTVEALDGQQACWLWHKPTRTIYLWRVMSPIYSGLLDGHLAFSSVKGDSVDRLLSEGVIYRLNRAALSFDAVDQFKFYNPYRIG